MAHPLRTRVVNLVHRLDRIPSEREDIVLEFEGILRAIDAEETQLGEELDRILHGAGDSDVPGEAESGIATPSSLGAAVSGGTPAQQEAVMQLLRPQGQMADEGVTDGREPPLTQQVLAWLEVHPESRAADAIQDLLPNLDPKAAHRRLWDAFGALFRHGRIERVGHGRYSVRPPRLQAPGLSPEERDS